LVGKKKGWGIKGQRQQIGSGDWKLEQGDILPGRIRGGKFGKKIRSIFARGGVKGGKGSRTLRI